MQPEYFDKASWKLISAIICYNNIIEVPIKFTINFPHSQYNVALIRGKNWMFTYSSFLSFTCTVHRLTRRCLLKLAPSSLRVSSLTQKKLTTTDRCLRRCFQTAVISYCTTGCPSGATPTTLLLVPSTTMCSEMEALNRI